MDRSRFNAQSRRSAEEQADITPPTSWSMASWESGDGNAMHNWRMACALTFFMLALVPARETLDLSSPRR